MGNRRSRQQAKYTNCLFFTLERHGYNRYDRIEDKKRCLNTAKKLLSFLDKENNEKVKMTLHRESVHLRRIIVTLEINGVSCVYLACIRDNSDIMEFFINDCQINPNMEIVLTGESILQLTCRRGNTNVAYCLIKHGANIDKRDGNGLTCIEACCRNERVCMFLVEHGVKVDDWKDENGNNVIFQACEQGNVRLVDFLLKHGTDINITNDEELSPLDIASRKCLQGYSFQKIVERLIKNGKTYPQYVVRAAETMFCELVQLYIREPGNLRKSNNSTEFWQFFEISNVYQLVLDVLDLDAYALTNNDILIKTEDIDRRIKSDIGLVFYISVQMTSNLYGGNSIKTINLVLQIVNFLCHQKASQGQFFTIIQSIFITSLKPNTTVSQKWLNELIIILVNFIRICKTPDENLCNFGLEIVLWVINKLKQYTVGQELNFDKTDKAESNISLDTVMRMFALLKLLFLWRFPCEEQRNRFLNKVMTELCQDNFIYESQSILDFGVRDFVCSNSKVNKSRENCKDVLLSLIKHGMSTDTTDKLGNTPLMFLLRQLPQIDRLIEDLVETLTVYSHLDIKNNEGITALTLLKQHGRGVCSVKNRTLQCLCAEVIKKLGVPYIDNVPRNIADFISKH